MRNLLTMPKLLLSITLVATLLSCLKSTLKSGMSNPTGNLKATDGLQPEISFKSQSEIDLLRAKITAKKEKSACDFQNRLFSEIIALEGIPRPQLKQLLEDLLSETSQACGGKSCKSWFGFSQDKIDSFLDDSYKTLQSDTRVFAGKIKQDRDTLIASLKNELEGAQTAWSRPTVNGISYLPDGSIDTSEGVGAFMNLDFAPNTRNLDIGGGAYDANTEYLASRGVNNLVYDPYMRSAEHNASIMNQVKRSPVDTVTSMSILNVIDDPNALKEHIELCRSALKKNGFAYFKVWEGDGSGIGKKIEGGYQSNRNAKSYIRDISAVFGVKNVRYDSSKDVIIATKS